MCRFVGPGRSLTQSDRYVIGNVLSVSPVICLFWVPSLRGFLKHSAALLRKSVDTQEK